MESKIYPIGTLDSDAYSAAESTDPSCLANVLVVLFMPSYLLHLLWIDSSSYPDECGPTFLFHLVRSVLCRVLFFYLRFIG